MDKKMDWKAYRLTYTKQAKDILKTLSLEEKVSLRVGQKSVLRFGEQFGKN